MATIIPASGLDFQHAGGHAERRTLEALKALPEDYYVIRECKIVPGRERQKSGAEEDRLDFIVVGPELGVLILEVKDWKIENNEYEMISQYKIKKIERNGNEKEIDHPFHQAKQYKNDLLELLKRFLPHSTPRIDFAVVFPKLTHANFMNKFSNPQLDNPQAKWMMDFKRILFGEDIIALPNGILTRLQEYVNAQLPAYHSPLQYTREQVKNIVEILLPSEMRVGRLPDHSKAEEQFKILDEEQQKWVMGTNYADKKYLVDVAGSGKTNVLLSRAIYLAKQHYDNGGCRILVTTYNMALKNELDRILGEKIAQDRLEDYYKDTIHIKDIVSIMEDVLQKELAEDFQPWKAACSEQKYIEKILPTECRDIIENRPQEFAIYDYLLIDEVQDFSTGFLHVAINLLKNKQNLFVVGDIGQKLFDRTVEWWDIDMGPERVSLPRRFLMYRSPQPIAKLAWKFLISDSSILLDLQEEKYDTRIKPKSPLQSLPNFIPCTNEDDLLQCIVEDIQNYIQVVPLEKMLCIGLKEGMLSRLYQKLTEMGIQKCWAKEARDNAGKQILLADYMDAKGLERDYVFIVDADHLAIRQNLFDTDDHYRQNIRRDRIKLFIALTRAMREIRLYYINYQHPFIKEIRKLEAEMNQ